MQRCGLLRAAVAILAVFQLAAAFEKPRDCGHHNCYHVLQVDQRASEDDIKKAYRGLAKQWHPDKNMDNQEQAQAMFTDIGNAYEILTTERASYDQLLRYGGRDPFRGHGRQQQYRQGGQNFYHQQGYGGGGGGGGNPINALGGLVVPLLILGFFAYRSGLLDQVLKDPKSNARQYSPEGEGGDEPAPPRADRLLPSTRVVVQGLVGAAQHNGKRGGVKEWKETPGGGGRYYIQLDGRDLNDLLSLKPANVQPVVSNASIVGGDSRRRDCHSAAPPSNFSRCFNSNVERATAK